MADERLTDQNTKTTTPARADLVHNVDVSDTGDHVDGSSFQMSVDTLLGAGLSKIQGCVVLARTGSDQSMSALETGDLVIYENVGNDIFIVATIISTITTVPDDLRDSAKAANWLDTSAAL